MSGAVAWLTGLPGSGKSTLGRRLMGRLARRGVPAALLDGDEVRAALGRPAGRGEAERDAFYRALAGLAALLAHQGLAVVVAATAPRRRHRAMARALVRAFLEVHLATPAEVCARRDPRGLWAGARAGRVRGLPGAGTRYQPPLRPGVVATGGTDARAIAEVVTWLASPRRAGGSPRGRAAQPASRTGMRRRPK